VLHVGWQSVPDARCSDEECAISNCHNHEDDVTRADVDTDHNLFLASMSATQLCTAFAQLADIMGSVLTTHYDLYKELNYISSNVSTKSRTRHLQLDGKCRVLRIAVHSNDAWIVLAKFSKCCSICHSSGYLHTE